MREESTNVSELFKDNLASKLPGSHESDREVLTRQRVSPSAKERPGIELEFSLSYSPLIFSVDQSNKGNISVNLYDLNGYFCRTA